MIHQLPLDIRLPREPDLDGFIPGPNAAALAAVYSCASGGAEPYLYLWGGSGSGKTHLLLGACRTVQRQGGNSQYLDLRRHAELHVAVLQGLEQLDLLCLDNVESITGKGEWEQALFDLFNRLREAGAQLLAAGDAPAAELPLDLADLHSRLGWGPSFRLRPLDDTARMELLHRSAAARGMELAPTAARYILNHCPRDLHSLEALLDRLDRRTLAEQKKPTIAVIRRAMDGSDEI